MNETTETATRQKAQMMPVTLSTIRKSDDLLLASVQFMNEYEYASLLC